MSKNQQSDAQRLWKYASLFPNISNALGDPAQENSGEL